MRKMTKRFAAAMSVCLLTAAVPVTAHAGQWQKDQTGWWYQNDNGNYPVNQWQEISGRWYYFEPSGYMKTGWLEYGGNWYFLGPDGSMFSSGLSTDGHPLNREGHWIVPAMSKDEAKAELNAHRNDKNYIKELENFVYSEETAKLSTLTALIGEGDFEDSLRKYIAECNALDYSRFYHSGNKAVRYFATLYEMLRVNSIHTASEFLTAYGQNDWNEMAQILQRYSERTEPILKDMTDVAAAVN